MSQRILIVDDEKDMLLLLERIIKEDTPYRPVMVPNPIRALEIFKLESFDVVITDLKMPNMNGMELLEQVKAFDPDVQVIILTAFATIETAIEATRKGAYDYLTKPFRRDRLLLTLEKVMELRKVIKENHALRDSLAGCGSQRIMIGDSSVIRNIFEQIRRVSPTTATVLITGASGTGKELAARAVHEHSLRKDKRIVLVNCTSIPENVLESELFGHVRGAFTGAWKDKKGLVEEADGGTLFLDEIGDLSPSMQTKLLRLLQEGEYKSVGSVSTKKADIRFIAATNHNLEQDIREKRFREDLFYRLNVIHFEMPSLSKRKQDIPLLAHYFLNHYAKNNNKNVKSISPAAIQTLVNRDYPGNIRELENIIERAVIFCEDDTLKLADLGLKDGDNLQPVLGENLSEMSFRQAKSRVIEQFHRHYLGLLLEKSSGNVSRAAEMAGIQRQYLHRILKESGISTDEFKPGGDDKETDQKSADSS